MNEKLSGPAMRTFLKIAREWNLTEPELRHALGTPTRQTVMIWSHDARRRQPIRLPAGVLERLTYIIQIHLTLIGRDQAEWIRTRHSGVGVSPIALIVGPKENLILARNAALSETRRCS